MIRKLIGPEPNIVLLVSMSSMVSVKMKFKKNKSPNFTLNNFLIESSFYCEPHALQGEGDDESFQSFKPIGHGHETMKKKPMHWVNKNTRK